MAINLSAFFIHRKVATTLLAVGIAFAGIVAFNFLPVSSLPRMDFPTISVSASLPGASPDIMASSIATPLERQIGRISGVTELTSASSLGSTRISVQFDLTRDIDGAARDIQAAINAAQSQLPSDLPNLPTYRKVNPSDAPILIISLTSTLYTRGQMYDAASTILAQKLSQIEGVGQVLVGGSSLPAVRVELNPTPLNHYGISLEAVRTALSSTNANTPKGQLQNGNNASEIITNDQLFNPEEYMPIIISYHNNAPVRIRDVAEEVVQSVEDIRNAGISDGKPSVVLIVFKQPGSNIIETVDRVQEMMPLLRASIPAGIDLTIMSDRTVTIRASLRDVEATLILAIILVVAVVFVFLGNIRAAAIPSVAVPLSLLGTFAIMYLCQFSLDNLSLMALTIATGFVVDDAVVVLENIERHIENGMKPMQAALKGSREVGFTVLSMSCSLVAVFIPILFMGGIVGRLFREFGISLSIAIGVSLFVSLTITPMMCSILLKPKIKKESKTFYSRFILNAKHHYKKSLHWALDHETFMLIVSFATIAFTIYLYIVIPKGFFPQQDTGRLISQIQAQQNLSFQDIEKKLQLFNDIISHDPAVEHVVGIVGTNVTAGNAGSMYITLKPLEERKISADQVINRLRKKVSHIAGANLYMQVAQDLVIGARQSNAQFQYTLTADTLDKINEITPRVMNELRKVSGIIDLNSDQRDKGLQEYVTIDHDTASRFGITPFLIDQVLYDAFGQRQVSTMYTDRNQYHVVMEVAPRYWQFPETLNDIYIPGWSGMVPLSAIASFDSSNTLLAVNHQSQFPAATLSFNLRPGISLGDAVDTVQKTVSNMHLPQNVIGSFQGTAQAFQASLATEPYLILAALFAVYIVLGILYESLIHPITILSTLPSAGVGALLALLMTGTDLSIIALIGIILLIGIVKKNAIMMIDFALHLERNEKKSPEESILEAAVLRFRPIMMTTMAALLTAVPLAFGSGVGSELRSPLGIAIMGGLILSQILTLYTTPVIYLGMERLKMWVDEKFNQFMRGRAFSAKTLKEGYHS